MIVTSAVGMDVNTSRADLLPGMLARCWPAGPLGERRRRRDLAAARRAAARAAGERSPRAIPDRVALELTARLELRGIDWATTRAFAHPADNQGYVRLNLRGRERDGIVDPSEAEALIDEIAAGLRDVPRPDGAPAVASVERVADLYPGARAGGCPTSSCAGPTAPRRRSTSCVSARFGDVRRHGAGSGRSGNHTPGDAWAVVAPGASRHAEPSRPARLADVAATVAAVSGADRTPWRASRCFSPARPCAPPGTPSRSRAGRARRARRWRGPPGSGADQPGESAVRRAGPRRAGSARAPPVAVLLAEEAAEAELLVMAYDRGRLETNLGARSRSARTPITVLARRGRERLVEREPREQLATDGEVQRRSEAERPVRPERGTLQARR